MCISLGYRTSRLRSQSNTVFTYVAGSAVGVFTIPAFESIALKVIQSSLLTDGRLEVAYFNGDF